MLVEVLSAGQLVTVGLHLVIVSVIVMVVVEVVVLSTASAATREMAAASRVKRLENCILTNFCL